MRLGDAKFFNLFELVAARSNPGRTRDIWQIGPVVWTRERTSYKGPHYSFHVDVDLLDRPGGGGWTLLTAHEIWWDRQHEDAFRNGRWVRLVKGSRGDVLTWFAEQETILQTQGHEAPRR